MKPDQTFLFEEHRRLLEGIAYRMLGGFADAQDVVQETLLRWIDADHERILAPRAWLIAVCTRLSLNALRSTRRRRETYPGDWLPEPFPSLRPPDPQESMELDESISIALLVSMESLSAPERASWILHDVFDLPFEEIAGVLERTSESCRQLASRARKRLRQGRPRHRASPAEHKRLLDSFFAAAREGDLAGLREVLSPDVVMHSDGGGKVEALWTPLAGAEEVANFLARVFVGLAGNKIELEARPTHFNGVPGLLLYQDKALATALTIEVREGKIERVFAIRNPEKLDGFQPSP